MANRAPPRADGPENHSRDTIMKIFGQHDATTRAQFADVRSRAADATPPTGIT